MAQSIYRNLDIWKLSIELSKKIYTLCSVFPKSEIYGLSDQMRRASISIASNIAEGSGRGTIQENIHFLHIARGSCAELETQVISTKELGMISDEELDILEPFIEGLLIKLSAYIKLKRSQKV